MVRKILVFILFLVATAAGQNDSQPIAILKQSQEESVISFYRVGLNGTQEKLIEFDEANLFVTYQHPLIFLDENRQLDVSSDVPEIVTLENVPLPTPGMNEAKVGIYEMTGEVVSPLYGPYAVSEEFPLYLISGEDNPYVNLYAIQERKLNRVTDVVSLFPDAHPPILSASAEFIALRPHTSEFLYRARLRDVSGTDFNALYLYNLETGENAEAPFFGKTPVWSLDGMTLAGSRFGETLYELWLVNLETGEERFVANGCNPQFSSDGIWLGYDLHDNPISLNYTDCFANGLVEAYHLETHEKILLSAGLEGYFTLAGWVE